MNKNYLTYRVIFKVIFITLLLIPSFCLTQEANNIHTSVTPEQGTTNTEFFLQISVSSSSLQNIGFPAFEQSKDLELKAKSTSISEQIINGSASYQKTFLYEVTAKHSLLPGEYQLPRGAITISDTKYRLPTKSLKIEPASNFMGDALKSKTDNGFSFIQLVSKENPYQGEQISYRVEIIAPTNLVKAELEEFEPEGVWRERFGKEEKSQRQAYNITINSFSEAWFPISEGTLEIPKRVLRSELRQINNPFGRGRYPGGFPNGSLAEQLLGGMIPMLGQINNIEKTIEADSISLKVRPLPKAPEGVSGYIPVGQISVTSSVDTEEVKVGEPVTLTIQVSGDANIRPLELGKEIKSSEAFTRYDDQPIVKRIVQGQRVAYFKTYKTTLIPNNNGKLLIPQFKINWFDPESESYKSEITLEKTILVKENPNVASTINTPEKSKDKVNPKVKEQSETIANSYAVYKRSILIPSHKLTVFFSLLPFLILIYHFLLNTFKKFNTVDNKKASYTSLLKELELSKDESSSNLENIISKLKLVLSDYYKINSYVLTSDEIINSLKNTSAHNLALIIKDLENRSYSGLNSLDTELRNKILIMLKKLR